MTEITTELMNRIVDKVKGPDNVFNLLDVERELIAEIGISADDAKRIVRAWDRTMTLQPGDLAKLFDPSWMRKQHCDHPDQHRTLERPRGAAPAAAGAGNSGSKPKEPSK